MLAHAYPPESEFPEDFSSTPSIPVPSIQIGGEGATGSLGTVPLPAAPDQSTVGTRDSSVTGQGAPSRHTAPEAAPSTAPAPPRQRPRSTSAQSLDFDFDDSFGSPATPSKGNRGEGASEDGGGTSPRQVKPLPLAVQILVSCFFPPPLQTTAFLVTAEQRLPFVGLTLSQFSLTGRSF